MIPKLIINSELDARIKYIQKLTEDSGFFPDHPDLLYFGADEKLGMEQARKIKNFLKLKPYSAKGQTIVLCSAENLTDDAQNALLKILEEHATGVNLILGAESEDRFLPTLISRCQIVTLANKKEQKNPEKLYSQIEDLLSQPLEKRFQAVEKIDEKEAFLEGLTQYFRDEIHKNKPEKGSVAFAKDLLEASKWKKANVNIRAILEYLMLKMPQK